MLKIVNSYLSVEVWTDRLWYDFYRYNLSGNRMKYELLRLCGYSRDEDSLKRAACIEKNYSEFDAIVKAILNLEVFFTHSDYYLSLTSDRNMIKIKNDVLEGDAFMTMDADIIVWSNEHNIELEEGIEEICILGFKQD